MLLGIFWSINSMVYFFQVQLSLTVKAVNEYKTKDFTCTEVFQVERHGAVMTAGDGAVVQRVFRPAKLEPNVLVHVVPALGHLFHPTARVGQRGAQEPGFM